jgi:hypothetical protein
MWKRAYIGEHSSIYKEARKRKAEEKRQEEAVRAAKAAQKAARQEEKRQEEAVRAAKAAEKAAWEKRKREEETQVKEANDKFICECRAMFHGR